MTRLRRAGLILALFGLLPILAPVPVKGATTASNLIVIKALSNRADLISGGDALVEIVLPGAVSAAGLVVTVNGRDISSGFAPRPALGGRIVGLVTGMVVGPNQLVARDSGAGGAQLLLTNHPVGGPIFSGPQILPWFCSSGATDAQCDHPTQYAFYYRSTNPLVSGFQPYDPSKPAADVASTTTDQGKTVPYIVRVETGWQDRDQYQIAVLFDPTKPWTPWAPQPGWNHKLLINHGASCGMQHGEGKAPDVLNDEALSRGFSVMSTALDNNGHNCNLIVQAESLMMAKEHLVESYGEIRYTFGTGCSGGSLTQYQVADAYPGIYQGILPQCSYPDAWSTGQDVDDCHLFERYWENPGLWGPGVAWTETQQAAAGGHFSDSVCHAWNEVFSFWVTMEPRHTTIAQDPLNLQNCGVPPSQTWSEQNPTGVRCDLADYMVDEFGRRGQDGYANRALDNVGVLYGLQALRSGQISPAQFVDLNSKLGSDDINYNWQPGRVAADAPSLPTVYRSGAVNEATFLNQVAIIDRPLDNVEIHEEFRSFAARARMDHAYGGHGNQVIWYGLGTDEPDPFLSMDRWLAAVEADHSGQSLTQKIVADRPADITDRCEVGSQGFPTESACQQLVGPYEGTRAAAGGPFAEDVIKCQLKPLVASDYFPVLFTSAQWSTLQQTFPKGVCDWSKPGVGQQPALGWMTFQGGPGGSRLGPAPASSPI